MGELASFTSCNYFSTSSRCFCTFGVATRADQLFLGGCITTLGLLLGSDYSVYKNGVFHIIMTLVEFRASVPSLVLHIVGRCGVGLWRPELFPY